MSDSVRPHRQPPTRLLCPWDPVSVEVGLVSAEDAMMNHEVDSAYPAGGLAHSEGRACLEEDTALLEAGETKFVQEKLRQ